jgi:hypothetical protein
MGIGFIVANTRLAAFGVHRTLPVLRPNPEFAPPNSRAHRPARLDGISTAVHQSLPPIERNASRGRSRLRVGRVRL